MRESKKHARHSLILMPYLTSASIDKIQLCLLRLPHASKRIHLVASTRLRESNVGHAVLFLKWQIAVSKVEDRGAE